MSEATARVITNAEINMLTGLYPKQIDHTCPIYERPIVFLLNGAGANGKDTFVNELQSMIDCPIKHFSSVDRVYRAMEVLLDDIEYEKTDEWRTLMHDIKAAWRKYNNGPYYYIMDQIMSGFQQYTCSNALIFIDIREIDEIQSVREECKNRGIVCFTIYVHGLVDPSAYTNSSDRNVDQYEYDFNITNISGDMKQLRKQIYAFAAWVNLARCRIGDMLYGNTVPGSVHVSEIDIPKDDQFDSCKPNNNQIG